MNNLIAGVNQGERGREMRVYGRSDAILAVHLDDEGPVRGLPGTPEERRGVERSEDGSDEGDMRKRGEKKWVTYKYLVRNDSRRGSSQSSSVDRQGFVSYSSSSSPSTANSTSEEDKEGVRSRGRSRTGKRSNVGGKEGDAFVTGFQQISERLKKLLNKTESCFQDVDVERGRMGRGLSKLWPFEKGGPKKTILAPVQLPLPSPAYRSPSIADVIPTVKNLQLLKVKKAKVVSKVCAEVQTDEIKDCFLPPLSELKKRMGYKKKPCSNLSITSSGKKKISIRPEPPGLKGMKGRKMSLLETRQEATLYPDTLKPFLSPKEAVAKVILQLENPEWEVIMQGLEGGVRLVRHHGRYLQHSSLHSASLLVGRHIRNLRSQVARAAAQASMHMFLKMGRAMDQEVDDLCGCLLSRMADTNKFLRGDCMAALAAMVDHASPSKTVAALVNKGAKHQNAVMRCATCRLFLQLATRLGSDRVLSLPRETRDSLLTSAAKFLTEGSLETRRCTKDLFTLLADDPRLLTIINEVVPNNTMRSIGKTLNEIVRK